MNINEAIEWLKSLKCSIGSCDHYALWHYAEAIDKIIKLLDEKEEKKFDFLIKILYNIYRKFKRGV